MFVFFFSFSFCFVLVLIFLTCGFVSSISLQPFSGTFANSALASGVGCGGSLRDWRLMMRDCSDGFDSCQIAAIRCFFFSPFIPQAAAAAAVCFPLNFVARLRPFLQNSSHLKSSVSFLLLSLCFQGISPKQSMRCTEPS